MGRLSKRAAVEHACSGRALMCHVMGAGCCSDQYAPPRALPNVRECGTVPTDTVVYVPTPGQTPGHPLAAAAHFSLGSPRVWDVQGNAAVLRATQWAVLSWSRAFSSKDSAFVHRDGGTALPRLFPLCCMRSCAVLPRNYYELDGPVWEDSSGMFVFVYWGLSLMYVLILPVSFLTVSLLESQSRGPIHMNA